MASSSARLYGVREETLLSSELSAVSQRCRDTPEVRLRLSRWLPPPPPGDRQRGVLLVTQGLASALMTVTAPDPYTRKDFHSATHMSFLPSLSTQVWKPMGHPTSSAYLPISSIPEFPIQRAKPASRAT